MKHGCWTRSVDRPVKGECAFGERHSTKTIALLGDSHAEHWLGGLERAGKAFGWRIEAHMMGGCPVSDFSALIGGATARRYRECSRYRETALAQIVAQKPDAVFLSSFDSYIESGNGENEYQVHEAAWTEGLRRTYSRSFSRALGGILGDRLEAALSSTRRELAAGQALRRSVRIESIARRD